MQNEITKRGPLLNENGELIEQGYSKELIKDYSRKSVKANKMRIKEWDYFLVYNSDFGLCFTISDNSYMGLASISVIDFKNKKEKTMSKIDLLTNGNLNMPSFSYRGNTIYSSEKKNKRVNIGFKFIKEGREIRAIYDDFYEDKSFTCNIVLKNEPKDSIVVATPFENDKKAFYYNQKICGYKAYGYFKIGDFKYEFNEGNTRALLDWGRGVWTRDNIWYWGAACNNINGHEVAFNIGYGFGDNSLHSENAIFYDGELHKLDRVIINIPLNENSEYDYLKEWNITSNDKRFEMTFTPLINRSSLTDIKILISDQNQVFGKFNGFLVLNDGKKIEVKDFLGFIERVRNKW